MYHLLFIFLSFTYDDCVNRFHEKKHQSSADPPVLRIISVLYYQINAHIAMGQKYNPGKDTTKEREKGHSESKASSQMMYFLRNPILWNAMRE